MNASQEAGSLITPSPPPSTLTLTTKLGWAIGQFAVASHMAVISIYLLFYLTNVHRLPGTLAGTLILVPRLWNIVTDPLMGSISDRVRSRWGRRRPFLLAGSLVWGLSYVAMFSMPVELSETAKTIWFLLAYFVVNTGLSLYHVPYSAMAPEMTRDPLERLSLIGFKEIASRATVLTVVLASPIVVALSANPVDGYRVLGIVIGAGIIASGCIAFFMTRSAPSVAFQEQKMSWKEQLQTFRSNRPLFLLSGAYLLSSAADAFYSALFIYFVTVSLGQAANATGILYPIGSLASIAMTPVWAWIGARLGKTQACRLAFAVVAACFLLSSFVPSLGAWWMYPFMVLLGATLAGMFLLPNAIVPDTVEYDEARSGMRREGTIFGAWIFTQQTGMALGAFLVGVYLDVIGHTPTMTAPNEAELIRIGFAVVPAAMLGLAIVLLRYFRLENQESV